MKKLLKSLVMLMLLFAMSLTVVACTGTPIDPPDNVTITSIQIATAGKTEFYVGDEFSTGDLSVEALKGDSTKQTLTSTEYTVDSSAYDKTAVGTYTIVVKLVSDNTKTVSYDVFVNAAKFADPLSALGDKAETYTTTKPQLSRRVQGAGLQINEITLLNKSGAYDYTEIEESYGERSEISFIFLDGIAYYSYSAYSKTLRNKRASTIAEYEECVGSNSINMAAYISNSIDTILESLEMEDVEYITQGENHILTFPFEDSGETNTIVIKFSNDYLYFEIVEYNAYIELINTTTDTVATPSGTFTNYTGGELDDIISFDLAPDPYTSSTEIFAAIMESADNTAALENYETYLYSSVYDADSGMSVQTMVSLTKNDDNVKLDIYVATSMLGMDMSVLMSIRYVENVLYVESNSEVYIAGFDGVTESSREMITDVSKQDFDTAFDAAFSEMFASTIDIDYIILLLESLEGLDFEGSVEEYSATHIATASETDDVDGEASIYVEFTDGKYLVAFELQTDATTMLYDFVNNPSAIDEPYNIEDYTDVTSTKTASDLFSSIALT